MSRQSENIFDNYEKRKGRVKGHYYAAAVSLLLIIVSLSIFVYIGIVNREEASLIPAFSDALDQRRYNDALLMYRSVHDTVVEADPGEDVNEQIEIMSQMEEIVQGRLVGIEEQVRYERYSPSSADMEFMNTMGELTSSPISQWLYSLSEEFLLGSIEKPDIIFIFNVMSSVSNISASTEPLLREIETIEIARGDVQHAEAAYLVEDYVEAIQSYQSVTDNYSGFVYDFSTSRIAEIKNIMYEPMVNEGEHMLDTFRYYSAEELLSDLAVIFPDDSRINADLIEATSHTSPIRTYYGPVEVVCIRQLIADTSVLSDGTVSQSGTSLYFTAEELNNLLTELYNNNYCLVDAESLIDNSNDTFLLEQNLIVPEGKKPVIIVIENLDYAVSTYSYGTCRRLVLNDQGNVCGEFINSDGQTVTSRQAEAIGVIDSFVEEHTDFSYNGAKGVISICGYESCFGYIVSDDQIDDRTSALSYAGLAAINYSDTDLISNRDTVSEISSVLLDTGWKFASSTYGNINASETEMDGIVTDTEKWIEQIEPLLGGDVHMIVYPGGNYINGTDPRAEYLKSNGFRVFFGIGSLAYYTYGNNYLYYDRAIINPGTIISTDYSRMFNSYNVLSDIRGS